MGMEKFYMYAQLYEAQTRFTRACQQIELLNAKVEAISQRYNRAKADNYKAFRYSLRMRLVVIEGMVNSYTDYAQMKKQEIKDLRFKLYGEEPDASDDETDSEPESDNEQEA